MLVRFRACDKKLNRRCGVIGQLKGRYGGHGLGIAKGILRVLRNFCTPGLSMPGAKRNRKLTPNLKLEKRIKTSVHTLTGDVAGNEQLAFVHLAGKSKRIHSEGEAQRGQLEMCVCSLKTRPMQRAEW